MQLNYDEWLDKVKRELSVEYNWGEIKLKTLDEDAHIFYMDGDTVNEAAWNIQHSQ